MAVLAKCDLCHISTESVGQGGTSYLKMEMTLDFVLI